MKWKLLLIILAGNAFTLDAKTQVKTDAGIVVIKQEDSAITYNNDNAALIDTLILNKGFPDKPIGWMNDFEGFFSKQESEFIDSLCAAFEKETSIEIVLVTIDSTFVTIDNFDNYITRLGNFWRIGKKGKDNGIIIGLCTGISKIRISNGYGIQTRISDSDTKMIIDKFILPSFRQNDYFEGIKKGIAEIIRKLR